MGAGADVGEPRGRYLDMCVSTNAIGKLGARRTDPASVRAFALVLIVPYPSA